jgi:hypothetical protein
MEREEEQPLQQHEEEEEFPKLTVNCSVCQSPADLKCERCGTPYCGELCSKSDWPQHRSLCKAFAEPPTDGEDAKTPDGTDDGINPDTTPDSVMAGVAAVQTQQQSWGDWFKEKMLLK